MELPRPQPANDSLDSGNNPTQNSARAWAVGVSALSIPWADLASQDDHDLFGTYDGDGGLYYVHEQWQAGLNSHTTPNWDAGLKAALEAVAELEPPQRGRTTDPRASDTHAWRGNVSARALELTASWKASIEGLANTSGTVTVGLDDPRQMRRTYRPLRDVLEHLTHIANDSAGTVILTTDAAVAELLTIYSDTDMRVQVHPHGYAHATLETASTLWSPQGDGAYVTLADALAAATALTEAA